MIIDSLKCYFPLNTVTVLNPKLISHILEVDEMDGEILKTYKKKSFDIKNHKATTKYLIVSRNDVEYLYIHISSKIRGKHLFKGLTINSIKKRIRQDRVVIPNYKFVKFSDVDFALDIFKTVTHQKKLFKQFKHNFKPKFDGFGIKVNVSNQIGILQCSRRGSATYNNPFIKIYDKYKEAHNNINFDKDPMLDYYTKFNLLNKLFKSFDDDDNQILKQHRLRTEFTVKNNQHFESLFGFKPKKWEIFTMPNGLMLSGLKKVFNKHFYFSENIDIKIPTQTYEHFLQYLFINQKYKLDDIYSFLDNIDLDRRRKHKFKIKIESILSDVTSIKNNYNHIDTFYTQLQF